MKSIIIENTWLSRDLCKFGWGNGYVFIHNGHQLHGIDYNEIDVNIHGGLTFSKEVDLDMILNWKLDKELLGTWCIGFDTAHYGDDLQKWPKEKVQKETDYLVKQILQYK